MIRRNNLSWFSIAAVLIFFFLTGCRAEGSALAANVEDKQLAVEGAADRLLARFYETRDFGIIWQEMPVSSAALRKREVDMTLFGVLYNSKATIPEIDKERAYVAQRTFNLLLSAVRFSAPEAFSSKEFAEELRGPYESLTGTKLPILSADDFRSVIGKLDELNTLLRKHVRSSAYATAAYKAESVKVDENEPEDTARVREGFHGILSNNEPIYVARREIHYLYFIAEGSEIKLLTIRSRRRF